MNLDDQTYGADEISSEKKVDFINEKLDATLSVILSAGSFAIGFRKRKIAKKFE